jgi:phospholipid/cholesterol/gamma-HCH transport system substrate-binding protein
MREHKRATLGLAYVFVVAVFIATTVLVFRQEMPWQRRIAVQLTTTTPGLQLNPGSDVKFQGVLVGQVRTISSDGTSATIHLAMDRDSIHLLPANIDAAIIPKTLFGEKYVDLRMPARPSTARLAAGGDIHQSTTSVELGAVFDQLVPILQTLKPAQVSVLLSTLAQALDGRGSQLGQTLTMVRSFLRQVNPQLDTVTDDIRDLGTTANIYADSTADLVTVLSNANQISDDLLVPQEKKFAAFLDGVIRTATTSRDVLAANAPNLITLTGRARPVLELLDTYSSELPCLIAAMEGGDRVLSNVAGAQGPWVQLAIDTFVHQEPYRYPQDLPSSPTSDANVHNLPSSIPNWKPHCPRFPSYITDVFPLRPDETGSTRSTGSPTGDPSAAARSSSNHRTTSVTPGALTEARTALARVLAAHDLGVPQDQVPGYAELLLTPLIANGQVTVR